MLTHITIFFLKGKSMEDKRRPTVGNKPYAVSEYNHIYHPSFISLRSYKYPSKKIIHCEKRKSNHFHLQHPLISSQKLQSLTTSPFPPQQSSNKKKTREIANSASQTQGRLSSSSSGTSPSLCNLSLTLSASAQTLKRFLPTTFPASASLTP